MRIFCYWMNRPISKFHTHTQVILSTLSLVYRLIYGSSLLLLLCSLDHGTVDWLIAYLTNLTETTVICVSHDTPFMEKICTDVIHYEQRAIWGPHRRLVHYKGKMSAFVEKQPQAKRTWMDFL